SNSDHAPIWRLQGISLPLYRLSYRSNLGLPPGFEPGSRTRPVLTRLFPCGSSQLSYGSRSKITQWCWWDSNQQSHGLKGRCPIQVGHRRIWSLEKSGKVLRSLEKS